MKSDGESIVDGTKAIVIIIVRIIGGNRKNITSSAEGRCRCGRINRDSISMILAGGTCCYVLIAGGTCCYVNRKRIAAKGCNKRNVD